MTRRPPIRPAAWRFFVPALLFPLLLALTIMWLQGEYGRWEALREDAAQSFARRSQMIELLSTMRSAETSHRGYAISGDETLRSRFVEAEQQVRTMLRGALVSLDDAAAQQRAPLVELSRTIDAKFAEMDEVLHLHDREGPDAARRRISQGEGQRLMAVFERTADQLIKREVAIGERRVASFRARTAQIQRLMWVILGVGSIALAALVGLLWRQRQARFRAALAAHEAAERNLAILNGTADPILIINPSGTIETVNAAVSRILGYEPAELTRRDVSVVADIAPGAGTFHERVGLVDGAPRKSFLHEHPVRHRNGDVIPFDIALGSMRLPDGDHLVMSLRDTTERRKLDQLKDDLISTVSHELRTPLTSIVGALSLLHAEAAGTLPEGAHELVQIAQSNGQRLIRLINDILDIDRIAAGKLNFVMAPVDLRDVVTRACHDHTTLASDRSVTLDCTTPDEPIPVEADDDRVLQVIVNLLSNALKFSPEGGRIAVKTCRGQDGHSAIVAIDDEGPGIPEEFRTRIFGRFERAQTSEDAPGTGLGLAIAREIVTRHGGKIWFEDRPGRGTRFAFSLPVAAPARLAVDITGEPSILICQSDPVVGRTLQAMLADDGYASRVVGTPEAAREAIVENGYSILLLDMALDASHAFDVARDVRRRVGPESISILMVSPTGQGGPGSPLSLDLIDWIEKPIDATRLKSAIAAGARGGPVTNPVVLHLDDDQDTLDVTARALAQDATILKARSLDEARALLAAHTPHLAIVDYDLEFGTGLDLLPDLVRADGVAIPTIIYSAKDVSYEDATPVDAVLVKSRTSIPDLKAIVRRVIAVRHRDADA